VGERIEVGIELIEIDFDPGRERQKTSTGPRGARTVTSRGGEDDG
jgi:hypothetical protein